MFHRLLRAAALACALIAAPIAALAGPISGYPAATTPLSGSETVIGTQSGSTVQITAASIAAVITGATSTWAGVQTFPAPGVNKGSIVLTPGTVSGTPANGSLWTTSGGVFAQIGGSAVQLYPASGTPAGSSGQLQYNNSGVFGGTSGLNWSGSALTIPDGGTLATTLDTFDKPVTSAVAAGTVAYSMAGGSGTFGCMAASGPGAYFLGAAGGNGGGSCLSPSIAWTNPASVTLTGATAINGVTTITGTTTINGSPTTFNDPTGAHNTGSISWTGSPAHPLWSMNFGGVLQIAGAGISADAAAGATLDVGNATPGDTGGTLQLKTINFPANGNLLLPSVTGVAQSVMDNTQLRIGEPLLLQGPAATVAPTTSFTVPTNGQAAIQQEGVQSGSSGYLGLSFLSNLPSLYCDQYAAYCTGRQMDFLSNDNFAVAGIENGANDNHSFEIGEVRAAQSMTNVSQLFFTDTIAPAGAVMHYNVPNGGSGYTSAPTATLTPTGCSSAPSTPSVYVRAGVVVGLGGSFPGAGCSAVTVSISGGGGTGATATTTLTSGETNASVGPTMIWEQLYNGGIASMLGLGQCDLTAARICFGETGNSGQAWETTPSAQPTFVIPGHIEFDTANGGGHNGFTGGESFSDAGGSVLQLQNAALTANAGLQVGFERVVPTTVSGLATVDASPTDGDSGYVTNATTCTFNSAVTGGGSTHCRVHYDGSSSSWKAG